MTLTTYEHLDQGTDEWLEARRGLLTASTVGKLITPKTVKVADNPDSRALTAQLVAERIAGWSEPSYMSDDMARGHDIEPIARDLYSQKYEPATELGFMVRTFDNGNRLGYSPDGLVGELGLIEVKAPRAKTHIQTILSGDVPLYHLAQIQAGMLVSGRLWTDFISYCAGLPMYVKRVHADPKWFEAITDALTAFETVAAQMVADYEAKSQGLAQTERINVDLGLVF